MRITNEILLKFAQDAVDRAAESDHSLVAAYLRGSLLYGNPLLGGAADIDLVFVQLIKPEADREIVRLTDDIHLDIEHHYQPVYQHARELRSHPWLGPTLRDARILHDPQHLLDFVQASVRGMFDQPETVIERARPLSESARQTWMELQFSTPTNPGPNDVQRYLGAIQDASNAVSLLSGRPISGRRLLMDFSERADAIGKNGLYHAVIGLLGGPQANTEQLAIWLKQWGTAYDQLHPQLTPPSLSPDRKFYYAKSLQALLDSNQPLDMLWSLLESWTQLAICLQSDEQILNEYTDALLKLGLLGDGFSEKVEALDRFLDMIEETVEEWAIKNGA